MGPDTIGLGKKKSEENEDGFMATALPPGAHEVEFRYTLRTPARLTGLTLSLLTLLTCTIFLRKGNVARHHFH